MVPALLLLAASPALATDTTWIYEMEGRDTVAAEIYVPTADGVRGRIVVRRPALREATYTIRAGEDGLPSVVTVEWRSPTEEGAQVETAFTARRAGSMVTMSDGAGNALGEYPVPEGAVPMTGRRPIAYGMLDLLARATAADGRRIVHLLVPGQPEPVEATLSREGETVHLQGPGLRIEATLDADGVVSATSRVIGGGSMLTFDASRSTRFDLNAFLRGGG